MIRLSCLARVTTAAALVGCGVAGAASFTVLHDFKGPDGTSPMGGLAYDTRTGTLYGTTNDKGAYGGGTLFRIAGGKLDTLHDFGGGNDGRAPYDDTLLLDRDGTLYGTLNLGGAHGGGAIFGFRGGAYAMLHSFPGRGGDGREPRSGLAKGADGALYGSTTAGGDRVCFSGAGCGTIFRFDPATQAVTTLHAFQTGDGGGYPWGTPTLTGATIAGTTMGVVDGGQAFTMRKDGSQFGTVAASFGATQLASGLVRDGGTLWGTSLNNESDTDGTIYSIDGSGDFVPHYDFHGRDGAAPYGRLLPDGGYLYGTTAAGGRHGCGTVFRYARGSNRLQTLHDFDCRDGNAPMAGLVGDGHGSFFGTTSSGGRFGNGTVFSVRP